MKLTFEKFDKIAGRAIYNFANAKVTVNVARRQSRAAYEALVKAGIIEPVPELLPNNVHYTGPKLEAEIEKLMR